MAGVSLHDRLRHLEACIPRGCPTCVTWTLRLDTDSEPSAYELEQQQQRRDRGAVPPAELPPVCPTCGRDILTVVIRHVEGLLPAPNSLAAHLLGTELEHDP